MPRRLALTLIAVAVLAACAGTPKAPLMTLPVAREFPTTEDFHFELPAVRLTGTSYPVAAVGHAQTLRATTAHENEAQYGRDIIAPLAAHLPEVAECYGSVLQDTRDLTGVLTLTIEVDQAGVVTGAVTEPAAGAAGLAAVGRCVESRARGWRLPSRPRPGVARITSTYELSPGR